MNLVDRARQGRRSVRGTGQSFFARAGIVFTGSAFGQGITFAMLPLTARIYEADVLGRAATVIAIVSISALVTCLQYDQAVVVAHDDELPYLLLLAFGIAAAWTGLISAAVLFDQRVALPGGTRLLDSWGIDWKLPVLILTYAIFTLLTNLGLRRNQLSKVSVGRTIYYGGAAILQVVGGLWLGGKESVFLLAQAAAASAAAVWLFPYREVIRWAACQPAIRPMAAEIWRVARVYAKFPRYQMGAGIVNAISMYMPIVFLRMVFSDAWAGWYFMAWRVVASPMTLVSQAIGQVFYRDSAERERTGIHQGQLVENVVFGLFRVSVLPCVGLGISAPIIVPALLGQAWAPVAPIIQILLVSTVVVFFTSPVSMLLNVKGLQGGALAYNVALFLGRVAALGAGWLVRSEISSIAFYSMATFIVMLLFCRYIVRSVGGSVLRVFRRAQSLVVDVVLILSFSACLWLVRVLYHPLGILAVGLSLCVALWRDIRRGGWRASPQGVRA